MQIEKILLPTDGSVHSINATNYALSLAKLYGAHVTIVCYYENWPYKIPEISEARVKEIKAILMKEAENILKKAEGIFAEQGVEYKLEIIEGPPGYKLANLAKSKKYDLIVMGSHGHSDIAGLYLGSVTHKVLNTIYCPVLIVP